MNNFLINLKVHMIWLLLCVILLQEQLLLAQDHHNHHHHYDKDNQHQEHHQRHHHLVDSGSKNNSKLTSAQLVAQRAEHQHNYNYVQQQQQEQQQQQKQQDDRKREERHYHHREHNKPHHNHQRQNAINSSGASKSSHGHRQIQQYYQESSSTQRPLTAHHNLQKQQQQLHRQNHHMVADKHHAHHSHHQRHAHDQFSQILPPSMAHRHQHHNNYNSNNNKKHQMEPNINYKPVVGSNNWLDNSLTVRTYAHMIDTDDADDSENNDDDDDDDNDNDDINVPTNNNNNNDYYDDMREDVDDYSEQEFARVTRHLPDSDYADDEPYRLQPGILTNQKLQEVGTKDAVDLARTKYMQGIRRSNHRLAEDHFNRMKVATQCSRPMPRVVLVSNLTSKRYEPPCTILHRCGEDTGCCNASHVCTVKTYEMVQLYFYVYGIDVKGTEIEELKLTNHTECHCVNRNSLQRRKRSGGNHYQLQKQQQHQQQQQHHSKFFDGLKQPTLELLQSSGAAHMTDLTTVTADKAIRGQPQTQICHCPKHFDVFVAQQNVSTLSPTTTHQWQTRATEACRCDCLGSNLPCQRLRDGEEGFPVDDRKCIAGRRCRRPNCKHGQYSHQLGRCPRHKDTRNDNGSYG